MNPANMDRAYRVGIITASDKGSKGLREDKSGPKIAEILMRHPEFVVVRMDIVPDEIETLTAVMTDMCDNNGIHLVLTTGGTGFSPRDVTPEATLSVVSKLTPGIPEAMRSYSINITPRGMLSRGVAGIRGQSLIINLPGSPKAIAEVLEYILPPVIHGLDILNEADSECARPL